MITKQSVPYDDQGYPLEGFSAYHKGTKRPLVLLCHAWRGRDDFICEKAEKIAELGYAGFAIDMYGKGVLGNSKAENVALKNPFLEDRNFLQRRLLQGYHTACSQPYVDTTRIVAVGFGFGALCALDLARSRVPLSAAVSVYGHFDAPKGLPKQSIKSKILILHGYNDPIAPMGELKSFLQELNVDKVDWQVRLYGNTFHAFATPSANDPANGILYNEVSAKRAWQEIEGFLDEILED